MAPRDPDDDALPPPPPPLSPTQQKPQVVDLGNPTSTVINQTVSDIKNNAIPLRPGETPVATSVVQIIGEPVLLQNATLVTPNGNQISGVDGYMRLVGYVVLDQGCNIMIDANMTVEETITPVSPDAKTLDRLGRLGTSGGRTVDQHPDGVFYDTQLRALGTRSYDIHTTQDLTFRSGTKEIIKVEGIGLRLNDAARTVMVTPGTVKKVP